MENYLANCQEPVGRIVAQYNNLFTIATDSCILHGKISGKLRYKAKSLMDFPCIGDFVIFKRSTANEDSVTITEVLKRKSLIKRKVAGNRKDVQCIAANVDYVFICMSLNNDYNLNRLERYIAVSVDSGATPIIVFTKADLCNNVSERVNDVMLFAPSIKIITTSSQSNTGISHLINLLSPMDTVALIGSSGVGKSTLINTIAGQQIMATNGLRNDDKGRHTTTHRELIVVKDKFIFIDTPGMRELGLEHTDLSLSYADIETLAQSCKFRNCTHNKEPHCAVQEAIKNGTLDARRLKSYVKLQKSKS